MDLLLLGLLGISILLFVLSFFQKDRYAAIEKEVEELSMNVLQENYQLKKRLRILEEELMMDGGIQMKKSSSSKKAPIHEVVKNQVIALHQQGISLDQIAKQSALSITDVKQILSKH
ncbi:helix-turn-helix domain-containing protein [Rossellomorea aquimaris]|uniref:helix-turn-helix domain-containing protein n=1 Tax=Rossellomorea aquimaris TaxID=189382 RepID=UPI0007D058CB|nr:helix-turn-helix domain-containing protein [Rossellomorea aquimaris]